MADILGYGLTAIEGMIYAHYEQQARERRSYLGGSRIGVECRRALWYEWRWYKIIEFPGRILRLFETGHREEERIIENLRTVGVDITGTQDGFSCFGGHVQGHIDGIAQGIPGTDRSHILECKTMNKRGFNALLKKGMENYNKVRFTILYFKLSY